MVEKIDEQKDIFIEYRDDLIASNFNVFKNQFSEEVSIDLEPHLIEWMVLRYKFVSGDIESGEYHNLVRLYSDTHDELFNNSLFLSAVKKITGKITTVV